MTTESWIVIVELFFLLSHMLLSVLISKPCILSSARPSSPSPDNRMHSPACVELPFAIKPSPANKSAWLNRPCSEHQGIHQVQRAIGRNRTWKVRKFSAGHGTLKTQFPTDSRVFHPSMEMLASSIMGLALIHGGL
ncbi:hypothetical protein EAF04_004493 [Stromatinia cepivora]|nr:hypothetical protein EAF04_004493 [Stromatinia cepivora]